MAPALVVKAEVPKPEVCQRACCLHCVYAGLQALKTLIDAYVKNQATNDACKGCREL